METLNKQTTDFNWATFKSMLEKKNRISAKELVLRYIVSASNLPLRAGLDHIFDDEAFNGFHKAIEQDGWDIVKMINELPHIYSECNAYTDQALHVLAKLSKAEDKKLASYAMNTGVAICMNGKDILVFAALISYYRGFGRSVKRILGEWYLQMDPRKMVEHVLINKKVTVTFRENSLKKKNITFSHRNLVRRLHLRGSDDVQDACLRIVKGYRGEPNEVPMMFRILNEINHLEWKAPGSIDIAINYSKGVTFPSKVYCKELQTNAKFMEHMFYTGSMSFGEWRHRFHLGLTDFLSDVHADRICFLMRGWIERQQMHPVELLIIRQILRKKGGYDTLVDEMSNLYYSLPVEREEDTASLVFLKYGRDNEVPVIHAYDKAYRLGGNLAICGEGLFPLDVKGTHIDDLLYNLPVFTKSSQVMQSTGMFHILNASKVSFKKVYVAEREFTVREHEAFLNALDAYVTGKSPNVRIVHHILADGLFDEGALLAEPRHGNIMTVYGANSEDIFSLETFLLATK